MVVSAYLCMYKKCKNLRYRSKKKTIYLYCVEKKKPIERNECFCCNYITFNKSVSNRLKTGLKSKSKKLNKMERNRKSVFTNDLSKCIECGKSKEQIKIDMHECLNGSNRFNSIKYDLVIPLCRFCHKDKNILLKWKYKGQKYFVQKYGYDYYIKIFKINYIEKHKKKK